MAGEYLGERGVDIDGADEVVDAWHHVPPVVGSVAGWSVVPSDKAMTSRA